MVGKMTQDVTCRGGAKVLWCRSLFGPFFGDSISACACFHFQNLLLLVLWEEGYKYFVYEHGAVLASFCSKLMFTLLLWPGSTPVLLSTICTTCLLACSLYS